MNTVETATTTTGMTTALTPYLAVPDARAAIQWYSDVFAARQIGDPIVMPDGRIGHAELAIGPARLFLSDAHPEIGVVAPNPERSAVTLHLDVADVDALVRSAAGRGATIQREPADYPYGRQAVIVDPAGHRWMLMSEPAEPAAAPITQMRDGDLAYLSVWSPDADRTQRFYAEVLGWRCEPAPRASTYRIIGLSINQGIASHPTQTGVFCAYGVHDLRAALEQVAASGGEAGDIDHEEYGEIAECTDPDGLRFALWQIQPGTSRPPTNGAVEGDLGYLTMQPKSADRTREFYGRLFGWTFEGGDPADAAPMTGISHDHDVPSNVAMWRVSDIDAAVVRVREAGGEAEAPVQRPYGRLSTCADDQGIAFYLGEL